MGNALILGGKKTHKFIYHEKTIYSGSHLLAHYRFRTI